MADQKLTKLANDLAPLLRRKLSTTTISGGTGSGAGVDDHGLLGGLLDNDHPQYLLRIGGNAMAATLNMGGHDINNVALIDGFDINSFSGTLTTLQMDVAALKLRTVYGGDGLSSDEVAFGDGSPTLDVVVADFAGAGLMDDGSNNLRVRVGDGLELDGLYVAVDEAFDFDWTGDHTHTGVSSSVEFDAGDPIVGAKIDWGTGLAWFSGIEATSLTVKTFISDVTLALQGSQYITKSKAELSRDFTTPSTTGTLYVMDLPGQPDTAVFESGDYIRLRYVNRGTGLDVGDVWGTVSAYTDLDDGEQSWTFTRTAGDVGQTIYEGMVALDYGQSGDGYIELSSLGDDTPVIRLRTWVTNPAVGGNHTTRSILGNLSGHTSAIYGPLDGFGMFSEVGYFTGRFGASDGNVIIDNNAVNIEAGAFSETMSLQNGLTFTSDPEDPDTGNTVGFVQGDLYEDGGKVYSKISVIAHHGDVNSTDVGVALFGLRSPGGAGNEAAALSFVADNGAVSASLSVQNGDSSRGTLSILGNISQAGHVVPAVDSSFDLGSASKYWANAYIDNLYVNTTVGTPDEWHHHDSQYYPIATMDSLLAGKSPVGHTHEGYVTSTSLATTLGDYIDADALALALDDYDTTVVIDGKLALKSGVGHSHALASLSERNYSSLQSRGHLLADADGVGGDHTVSGLTAGHVLRATGAETAKFMQLLYADLGSRTHDIVSEHEVTAARYSVVGTPNSVNTLAIWATASDGTAGNVLLRSDSNGDLILNDVTINDLTAEDAVFGGTLTLGDYWTIDSNGNFKSIDPSYTYADPEQGTLITPDGRIVALDIDARSGRFRAAVYEIDSTVVGPSSEIWTYAGGAMTQATTTIDSSGNITVAVQDGRLGHYRQYQAGETIRLRGPATSTLTPSSGTDAYLPYFMWQMFPAYTDDYAAVADVYLTIDSVSDEGTHFAYVCTWAHGSDNVAFPAGTPVIGYGAASDSAKLGAMRITSDANGPRLTAFEYGDDPWVEDGILALGSIGTNIIGWLDSDERGIITGTSIQSEDDFSGIVGSNKRMLIQNPDLVIKSNGLERLRTGADGLHLGLYVDPDISGNIDPDDYLNEPFRTGESLLTFSDTPSDYDSATGGRGHLRFEATDYPSYYASNYPGIARISDISGELAVRTNAGIASFVITVDSDLDQYFPGLLSDPPAASIALQSAAANSQITLDAVSTNVSGLLVAERAHAGRLRITDIPTSATGLQSGDVWSDGGTLKIVS